MDNNRHHGEVSREGFTRWLNEEKKTFAKAFGNGLDIELMADFKGNYIVYKNGLNVLETKSVGNAVDEYNKLLRAHRDGTPD